ncbi:MAG TPA: hypothetical protein VFU72_13605 [Nitrolancea sp.]|nr:hypothetical protein [Nitrolancea sp.]
MATTHRRSPLHFDPRRMRLERGRRHWPLSPVARSREAARQPDGALVAIVAPQHWRRERVVRQLEAAGFRTLVGHDLALMATRLRAAQPDVVVLGVALQRDPANRRLVERLRHDPATSQIPILDAPAIHDSSAALCDLTLVTMVRALLATRDAARAG